jgi:arabinan endo-1,5-alpha-L-arabinosidase
MKWRTSGLLFLAPALIGAAVHAEEGPPATAPPAAGPSDAERVAQLGSRGVRVHDPSTIVKSKEDYWVFYTGRGVPSYRSKDLIHWEEGPRVFTSAPAWIAKALPENGGRMNFWAPDVIQVGERYLLYYSVSRFGKNTSAIALVTNPTLDPGDAKHAWSDQGIVVRSGQGDDFNAIDPAVVRDASGGLWMAFGSFWSGIKLIQLDPATGMRIAPDSPMHSLARYDSIEAPFIYRHGESYFLFVNWGRCCRGVESTYNVRVGRSAGITGPYLDREGKDLLEGGGSLLLETDGAFIGPGHAGILKAGDDHWLSMHFYDGTRRGAGTLAIRRLRWDADGWPAADR